MTRPTRLLYGIVFVTAAALAIICGLITIAVTHLKAAHSTQKDPSGGWTLNRLTNDTSVVVIAEATSIDLNSQIAKFTLTFGGTDDLAANTSTIQSNLFESNQAINVTFGTQAFIFKKGTPLNNAVVTVPITGDISIYPFDSYSIFIPVFATIGDKAQPVTVVVALYGNPSGFNAAYSFQEGDSVDATGFAVVSRSRTTKVFAILISLLMWALTICGSLLSVVLWVADKKVEPPYIIFTTALLFAMPSVRSAMPGAPPIGALIDQIVMVWCMFLLSMAEVGYFFRFISSAKPSFKLLKEVDTA
ncbi:hypothetical protein BC830DRAFT_1159353 [Chytriomyces sp. MP71]|nr:hypothetical protein BC830DRAFT_1159353 [Chytriomyces sp. MP71]